MRFALLFLVLAGCVPATTDDPGADAAPLEVDAGVDPNVRPLDPCAPLLNQALIPWAEAGVPEGTCVKIMCPEGAGAWRLMVCNKPGAGGGEVYWEIDQDGGS